MIETKEDYRQLNGMLADTIDEVDHSALLKTIDALRDVARAAKFAVYNNVPFLGQADLQTSIDALPDWLLEEDMG